MTESIHGVLVTSVRPRTGRTATCERCGKQAEATYDVPGRRFQWRHVERVSPFVRRALRGELTSKDMTRA